MLVANMDCAHEPTMEGLYEKSKILERGGRKIGLIGVILETTYVATGAVPVRFKFSFISFLLSRTWPTQAI